MTSFFLASLALVSGLSQNPSSHPPPADAAPVVVPAGAVVKQVDGRAPAWMVSLRSLYPVTTTDPQHVGVALGLAHSGAYRATVQYQPSDSGRFGSIHAALGMRVLSRAAWNVTLDLEHTQARPVRRLVKGAGWELAGHDRHQLSIGTATVHRTQAPWFGLVRAVEVGGGRMHVWRLVSAIAGDGRLGESPDPILESSAPVAMVGLVMARPLFMGLQGETRLRLIGAGHSRGGEVPFAHLTAEWDVSRRVFQSSRWTGLLGVTGNHATSPRAAAYFQNGVGLALRIAF